MVEVDGDGTEIGVDVAEEAPPGRNRVVPEELAVITRIACGKPGMHGGEHRRDVLGARNGHERKQGYTDPGPVAPPPGQPGLAAQIAYFRAGSGGAAGHRPPGADGFIECLPVLGQRRAVHGARHRDDRGDPACGLRMAEGHVEDIRQLLGVSKHDDGPGVLGEPRKVLGQPLGILGHRSPFRQAPAEQRLLRGTLGHLDLGVDGAVVIVQGVAGGQMFLGITQGDDRRGECYIAAAGLGFRTRLRDEARATREAQDHRQG